MRVNKKYYWIFPLYAAVLFLLFLISRLLAVGGIYQSVWPLVWISLTVSLAASIGGFLGAKWYFLFFTALNLAGVLYMLILALSQKNTFGDLASLLGFMVFSGAGWLLGVGAETVAYFIGRKEKRGKKRMLS